ncbi:MAG: pyridoxine 5'-phosphate synthase [Bacteriovoracia bacterium]
MYKIPKLGVNIDHVATLRQLRNTPYPDLLTAADECIEGGADQITVHLREDRRHIQDTDVFLLRDRIVVDLNFEMAATQEMFEIAFQVLPHSICIVPEKREEKTTEGGLDLSNEKRNEFLKSYISKANEKNILVSLFIEPEAKDILKAKDLGAGAVELHTGAVCLALQNRTNEIEVEWKRLKEAVQVGRSSGLRLHAGHGIDYSIARELVRLEGIEEFNIGHAIVCESVFCGLKEAVRKMKEALR